VSVERVTFPQLLSDGATVLGYVDNAYWLDVGTPAAIVQASADLVTGVAPSPAVPEPGGAVVAPTADVHATATVHGGSAVADKATVGPGAVVDASIVMTGAVIDADAEVVRSVIGANAVVGAGCRLVDVVVGADAQLGARNELLHGARVWPGVSLPDVGVRFSTDA
jgi:mannose-1-phosphate guanylyltransferase